MSKIYGVYKVEAKRLFFGFGTCIINNLVEMFLELFCARRKKWITKRLASLFRYIRLKSI